jgi:HK97 gp10 family phage protein
MLNFRLDGVEDAIKRLHRAVAPVNDQRVAENAATALEPVAEEARRLVPKNTMALHDSIGVEIAPGGGSAKFEVIVGVLNAGGRANVFYAHFIEFGTVTMRANPFLAPAVFMHEDLIFDTLALRIGEDITGAL